MSKIKRTMLIVVAGVVILSLVIAGCAAPAPTPTPTPTEPELPTLSFKLGHWAPPDSAMGEAFQMFKEAVESRTDGKVTIEVYPSSQLGGLWEMMEAICTGGLDMGFDTFMPEYAPEFEILYVDFVFVSWDDAWEAFTPGGWFYKLALPLCREKMNIEYLAPVATGSQSMSSNVRLIRVPDDLKGQKMRHSHWHCERLELENYGALPVAMDAVEIYMSLQQGLIDGEASMGPELCSVFFGEPEVIKYHTNLKHVYEVNNLAMHLPLFNSMPAEYQKIFREEAMKACRPILDCQPAIEAEYLEGLRDKGIEVITWEDLSPAEQQQWYDKAYDMWPNLADFIGQDIMDEVMKIHGLK